METINEVLLAGAVLVLLGVLSSKLSGRLGLPVLVLFLTVGMLAGSEGIGGIHFEDYEFAYGVGTVALAIILFDGGLSTSRRSLRAAWRPALVLATAGVLLTAVALAVAAWALLGLPPLQAMLLGSIVSSTDAAAVFTILRKQRLRLEERLSATLEVESASNDPMAVFLTVSVAEVLLGRLPLGPALFQFFLVQMVAGGLVGLVVAHLGVRLVNRIDLDASGLYPIFAGGCGFLAFGLAAALGGSGFLAVYVAGVVIGNARIVYREGILHFHDAAAWISQIVMFTLLGLLSFPRSIAAAAGEGLLLAAVLVFVARPLAVFVTALPFRFDWRELTLLSWTGLKGAVPIILAVYPLMIGLPEGRRLFDLIFFVVLLSALVQGWSLAPLARWLRLERPSAGDPAAALELATLRHADAEVMGFRIGEESRAVDRRIGELPLPDGMIVSILIRGGRILPPRENVRLRAGDHIYVVLAPDLRFVADRLFAPAPERDVPVPPLVEIPLRGRTTVGELRRFFDIHLRGGETRPLGELLAEALGDTLVTGDFVERDGAHLVVRAVGPFGVEVVGVARASGAPAAMPATRPSQSAPDGMGLR